MTEIQLLQRLLRWIAPYWIMFICAIFCLIAVALSTSLLPLLIKHLLDHVAISDHNFEEFQSVLLTLLGLLALRSIASFFYSYAISWISGKVGKDLHTTLYNKLLTLPVSYTEAANTDKHYPRFFQDIEQTTDSITQILTLLGKEMLTVAGLMTVMLLINWEFSFMGILLALVIGTIMQFISQASNSDEAAPQLLIDPTFLSLTTNKHIKSIKLNGSHSQESQHFCNTIEQLRSVALKRAVSKTFSKTIAFITIATILAAFFILFRQQLNLGMISLGDAAALLTAALLLVLPAKRLLNMQFSLQEKLHVINDIDSLRIQQNETDTGKIELSRARGLIRFEQVSACNYSQTCPPLFNLTLTIQPGEIVAMTSSHDGQERTLIDLVARFIHPTNGRILLDDIDIATIKLADLRANIAWLSPDTRLLNDTIAANIAYGSTRCATEASIIKIARACHVTTFAREMPHGLQTTIDAKVIEFSENQRQCILIARALLKNPAIVIIDETTAEFDTDCPLVNKALDALIQNRTTLIISSQSNMLSKAHRVLVI